MIISRTPFRLSFAGGGTDLPSFYQEEDGAVLSTALNKYMHITINKRFDNTIRLSYSKTEIQNHVKDIEHPIFKYVLSQYLPQGGVEVISMADIPAGTGLGSSSSFTVAMLHAVKGYLGKFQTAEELASEASDIEINKLHEPIGKQDQYISAYGGLQFIQFKSSGDVTVDPIVCTSDTKNALEAHCMLFYTGQTRAAKSILQEQKENTKAKRQTLSDMAQIARKMKTVLEANKSLESFGKLLHDAWTLKKSVASNISSSQIDKWYEQALKAGAWGGKILGAGGGGFLMVFCEPGKQNAVKNELKDLKLFDVEFEAQGSKIIFVG
ncbi:MAG: GHMP kinase [Oligoflexia bacterium]|nr:GHMP kinase [Oligoflexia bacterium]